MSSRYITTILFFCFAFYYQAQELRSYQEKGLFGFKRGSEVVIQPTFSYASEFYDGFALVKVNANWGFIRPDGSWLVKPEFDNAQPFREGFALVLKGGKYGLIDRTGKQVVPIAFNRILKDWDGFQLIGEKQGYYNPKWDTYIPSKYDKIDHARYFSIARNGNNYDIFHDGKQLATTTYLPQLTYYNHPYLDLKKSADGDLYGVIDTAGTWIVPQVYSGFKVLNVLEYHIEPNDPGYFYVYELDSTKYVWEDEYQEFISSGPVQRRVLNARLEPLHKGFVQQIELQEGQLQLIVNDQLGILQSDGQLKFSRYNHFKPFAGKILARGKAGVDVLLEKDSVVLAHFGSYAIPDERIYDIDPDTGEERVYNIELPYPLILVSEHIDISSPDAQVALFDLQQMQFVTSYSKDAVALDELVGDAWFTALILRSGENKYNYWVPGTKRVSTFPFTYLKYVGGQFFMASEGEGTFLFSWITGKRFPLDGDAVAVWSTSLTTEVFVSDELGEGSWVFDKPYDVPFARLDYGTGKFGVIDPQERFYFGPFDSVVQQHDPNLPHNNYVLQVYDQGLCGMINLLTGEYISPQFNGSLILKFDANVANFYSPENPTHPEKYVSSKGKLLDGLPEDVELFKQNGRIGARVYAPFIDSMIEWVPPVYGTLAYSEYTMSFQAQDKRSKKWGLIDMAGDTLVPLIYDRLSYREMNLGMGDYLALELHSKKRIGLYHPVRKTTIPAVFERFFELELTDYNHNLLLAIAEGKCGLYRCADFSEILPAIYEGIWVNDRFESERIEVRVVKNGKTAIVWLDDASQLNQLSHMLENAVWYDLVVGNEGFLKTETGWIQVLLLTNESRSIENLTDVFVPEVELTLQVHDQKLGMKNKKGKWILPNIHTSFFTLDGSLVGFEKGILTHYMCSPDEKSCIKYTMYEW